MIHLLSFQSFNDHLYIAFNNSIKNANVIAKISVFLIANASTASLEYGSEIL